MTVFSGWTSILDHGHAFGKGVEHMEDVIFLDLETTGLTDTDEIIEIGAVKLVGGKEQTYQQLLKPAKERIAPRIFKLCRGLAEEELRRSPSFADIRDEFLEFMGECPLVCHNAPFEKRMLEGALGEALQNSFLDSLELFVLCKPQFPRHGMDYLMQHYLADDRPGAHRALADARDTLALVRQLFEELAKNETDLLERIIMLMQGTGWSWLPYLKNIVPALRHATEEAPVSRKGEPQCAYTLEQMGELLENEKHWQTHFPGYRVRPQQLALAGSVAKTFEHERALFVEAPTGSGKTLAYLLPAMVWAVREKEKVFISTNTKNLQQQVLKDLPGIAAVLGIENVNFADMKGISNYVCRRQVEEEAGIPGHNLETQLARCYLLNWAILSTSGELDDISYWFKLKNTYLYRLTHAMRCRREDCAARECNFDKVCFYNRRVLEMRRSHLCTINHSLLLTWPGGYPEIKKLIIDEAHALEDKAFEAFTREISSYELENTLDRLSHGENRGYLNYLRFYGRKVLPNLDLKPALSTIENIMGYAEELNYLLQPLLEQNNSKYNMRCPVPREDDGLKEAAMSLAASLGSLAHFLEETMTEISFRDEDFENSRIYAQGSEYMNTCRAWAGILVYCFAEEEEKHNCSYLECSENSWLFRITPLDVAEPFYNKVIEGCDALVLTSATLAEKGGYGRPARALGFNRLGKEKLVGRAPLPNVYDYARHSVLAIPADSPGYSSPGFIDYAAKAVLETAKLLGGRTLVLFSSLERMERVIEKVRLPLENGGFSVLGGRNGSKRADLEHFKEDVNAVLFGSRGFFEGVNIAGPALSCIIIDKLSFPYQADPLLMARTEYLKNKGLDPFKELCLSEATRTLRQQFGRLIRSETDKGFVLVLDQLGQNKWYCDHIISMLPGPLTMKNLSMDQIIKKMKEIFQKWGQNGS